MPTIHITLLGRFAVTVDGVPVAESNWSAPPRRGAREGARPGARPAPAPRADHRSRVARRHDRRGRAEAAQGGALRPAGHRRARTRWCCGATTSCCCPDADTTVDVVRFEELARRALADEDVAAAREALAMYGGELLPAGPLRGVGRGAPRAAAAAATSTCCASTVAGRRWSSSTRATSSPTSRSCAATRRTATATPRCASSSAWTARCAASSASLPGARRWRCATGCSPSTTSCPRRDDALVGRDRELADRRAGAARLGGRAQPHADRRRSRRAWASRRCSPRSPRGRRS